MEPPKTPALSSSGPELYPLTEESHEINTEFCEKSVTYSQLRIHCSSNIQKKNVTRNLKIKAPRFSLRTASPWALATVVFACLYLIVLVVAAIMIAKVQYLERMLKAQESNLQNETAH
ncbi:uncharacterized protein [Desmodus rotundus]|uniref:uncharacterized protein isoform X1 n=1 Tax=Desmodus rotundus TaxID=9430 RepID=UPI0039E43501